MILKLILFSIWVVDPKYKMVTQSQFRGCPEMMFMQYTHSPWWWWGGGCGGTEQVGWPGLSYIHGVTVAGHTMVECRQIS